jgi:hypothetical protein
VVVGNRVFFVFKFNNRQMIIGNAVYNEGVAEEPMVIAGRAIFKPKSKPAPK